MKDSIAQNGKGCKRLSMQLGISCSFNKLFPTKISQEQEAKWSFQDDSAVRSDQPKKRGRPSYHPLMCFIGETRDYLGGVLRAGNRTSSL